MRLAVIGIGSPFGADCIAWDVVEHLCRRYSVPRNSGIALTFEKSDRPGALLLEHLGESDCAILIDAVADAVVPAAWYDEVALRRISAPVSAHALGVAEILALGRMLGGLPTLEIMGLWMRIGGRAEFQAMEAALNLLDERLSRLGISAIPFPLKEGPS